MEIELTMPYPRGVKPFTMGFDNCCFVSPSDDLLAKYNWLKSSDRDAEMGALSATNRRTLVLTPGQHTITSQWAIDTKFVDIPSLTPFHPASTVVYGSFADSAAEITAVNVKMSGFTIQQGTAGQMGLEVNAANTDTDAVVTYNRGGRIADTGIGIGVEVADWIYISGAGVSDGWYEIIGISNDELIINENVGSGTGITYVVVSFSNLYRYMRFIGPTGTGPLKSDRGVVFNEHAGGTWEFCKADDFSWYVNLSTKDMVVKMSYCVSGWESFRAGITSGKILAASVFTQCKGLDYCFKTDCAGTFIECEAGDHSFAKQKEFSGNAYRCRAGDYCFGGYQSGANYGTFSGYAEDCIAGINSFGASHASSKNSGEMVRCTATGLTEAMYCEGATIRDCRIQVTGTDKNCLDLNDGNTKVYNSTLIANGTGKAINAGEAQNVVAAHCRSNKGVGANVTNLLNGANSLTLAAMGIEDSDIS